MALAMLGIAMANRFIRETIPPTFNDMESNLLDCAVTFPSITAVAIKLPMPIAVLARDQLMLQEARPPIDMYWNASLEELLRAKHFCA